MSQISSFEENLPKNQANYSPLTPLSFLTRTAEVFPERTAVIHGEIKPSTLWESLEDVRDSNGRRGGVSFGSLRNGVERRAGEVSS